MTSLSARARDAGRVIKRRAARALGLGREKPFTTSGSYWEDRYQIGGNSGSGSYGRLAQFKADFLNAFVSDHSVRSIIEFGSGDGAQLALANYPRYIGVDVSMTAVERCRSLYKDRGALEFIHSSEFRPDMKADLSLSLDVIYHLVEDEAYAEYMRTLFDTALRYVIIYSSNWEERAAPHVRHRRFTDWIASNEPDFELLAFHANPYPFDPEAPDNTTFADFYVYERVRL